MKKHRCTMVKPNKATDTIEAMAMDLLNDMMFI